jgi:signal peptidase I
MSAVVAVASLALLGALVAVRLRFIQVTVVGGSMEPTLTDGDRLMMVRRPVRPTDLTSIVLLLAPPDASREPGIGEWRIKRIVALPGDAVPEAVRAARGLPVGSRVPSDEVVVIGDNPRSEDSRHWSRVPVGLVVAVARRSPRPTEDSS